MKIKKLLVSLICLTTVFFAASSTLGSDKEVSCDAYFGVLDINLTEKEIAEELFNYKVLFVKLNEQKRLQAMKASTKSLQSLAMLQRDVDIRELELQKLGVETNRFKITSDDILKIKRELNGDPREEITESLGEQNDLIRKEIYEWVEDFELSGPLSSISSVEISSDNSYLLTVGDNHRAMIWSLSTREILSEFNFSRSKIQKLFHPSGSDPKIEAAFSPDGKSVIVAQPSSKPTVYRTVDGKKLYAFGEKRGIGEARFSKDQKTAITIRRAFNGYGKDERVCLWDLHTEKELMRIVDKDDSIDTATLSNNQRYVATGHSSGKVVLWDAKNLSVFADSKRAVQLRVLEDRKELVSHIEFSPDDTTVAVTYFDGSTIIWSTADGRQLYTLKNDSKKPPRVTLVKYSPDGKSIARISSKGGLQIYNTSHGSLEAEHIFSGNKIYSLAFSADGKDLAVGLESGKTIFLTIKSIIR